MDYLKLPELDLHAHIATDVTRTQVSRLGDAFIFAVTRSLAEASQAPQGRYPRFVWGVGVHPGRAESLAGYDAKEFRRLLERFVLVGEVGLDRRRGHFTEQVQVLESLLLLVGTDAPVFTSIHSVGATSHIASLLTQFGLRAPILHWFNGSKKDVEMASTAGAWYSVNAAMSDDTLCSLPPERVLTETDYPYTRRNGTDRPGHTRLIEQRLARVWHCTVDEVGVRVWSNMRLLVTRAGNLDRLPEEMRQVLRMVET